MKQKDIKLGEDYALKRSYSTPERVTVIEIDRFNKSGIALMSSRAGGPERIGSYYRTSRGTPMAVVKRQYVDHIEVVPLARIMRTWREQEAVDKQIGAYQEQKALQKKQHNEVTALRFQQLTELFALYGIDVPMRMSAARHTGYDEIKFDLDAHHLAHILSRLTGEPVVLPEYPEMKD